jgi:hypothetical protein
MRRASWMSLGIMVTRLAWIAHRLVLEQTHQVGFIGLLQGQHGAGLESQVCLEVLSDLTGPGAGRAACG